LNGECRVIITIMFIYYCDVIVIGKCKISQLFYRREI